jgi:hypothetical protein
MRAALFVYLGVTLVCFTMIGITGSPAADTEPADTVVSFEADIFPIIEKHCLPCHLREERNMSRLFMDNYDLLMKGGFNGPPIVPGDAEASLLIRKIGPEPPFGERMPMRSKRYLTDDETALIKRWINEGAEDN